MSCRKRAARLLAGVATVVVTVATLAAPAGAVPPGPVPNVSATAQTSTSVLVTWSHVAATPGRTGYDVAYSTVNDISTATIARSGLDSSATATTVQNLTDGETYWVWVRANNADGNGSWGTAASVTIPAIVPANAPANVRISQPGDSDRVVRLDWAAAAGGSPAVQSYQIAWSPRFDSPGSGRRTIATGRNITILSLRPATSYYFWVRAFNGRYGEWSSAVTWNTAGTAGNGTVDDDQLRSPSNSVGIVRDHALENSPIIIGVIGAIFLVGLAFYLVRRGLARARGAMRL